MTEPGAQPTCYRHRGVPATITCQRCGRPICPACMHEASVGYQCPECVSAGLASVRRLEGPFGGRISRDPRTTSVVLAVMNVVVWAAIFLTGGNDSKLISLLALRRRGWCMDPATPESVYVHVTGAACRAAGREWVPGVLDGGWWQPLTSAFTHVAFWHILGNLLTLWFIGPELERALGRARFLMLYLGSALAASAMIVWFSDPYRPTIGASGAIFGLLGGLLVVALRQRQDWKGVLKWIGLNLVITFIGMQFISWQGHVGGLLGGLALTAAVVYPKRGRSRSTTQWLGMAAITLVCVGLIVARALVR